MKFAEQYSTFRGYVRTHFSKRNFGYVGVGTALFIAGFLVRGLHEDYRVREVLKEATKTVSIAEEAQNIAREALDLQRTTAEELSLCQKELRGLNKKLTVQYFY